MKPNHSNEATHLSFTARRLQDKQLHLFWCKNNLLVHISNFILILVHVVYKYRTCSFATRRKDILVSWACPFSFVSPLFLAWVELKSGENRIFLSLKCKSAIALASFWECTCSPLNPTVSLLTCLHSQFSVFLTYCESSNIFWHTV